MTIYDRSPLVETPLETRGHAEITNTVSVESGRQP